MVLVLSLLIGVVAGLRAMTAPAAASWAASLGLLHLDQTWLAFLGYRWTPWIFTLLAAVELVTDQLPSTPSRKVPQQFGARIATGALAGAALSSAGVSFAAGSYLVNVGASLALVLGAVAGMVGAVMGTFGGSAARGRLAVAFGNDRPAALIEDLVAIGAAALIVMALR